jgi:nucleoid-associated protein YgaU
MDARVGVSFALSFLLVGLAAVVFYQPERPSTSTSDATSAARIEPKSVEAKSVPPPARQAWHEQSSEEQAASTRTEYPLPTPTVARAKMIRPQSMPAREETRPLRTLARAEEPNRPAVTQPISTRGELRSPRSAFTTAEPGETLAGVALRIYGTDEALRKLWLANRDQFARPEDPLEAGTILRTP